MRRPPPEEARLPRNPASPVQLFKRCPSTAFFSLPSRCPLPSCRAGTEPCPQDWYRVLGIMPFLDARAAMGVEKKIRSRADPRESQGVTRAPENQRADQGRWRWDGDRTGTAGTATGPSQSRSGRGAPGACRQPGAKQRGTGT